MHSGAPRQRPATKGSPEQKLAPVQVDMVYPLSSASPHNKECAAAAIHAIRSGSATNLSGGLLAGLEQQLADVTARGAEDAAPSAVHSVLLFTDGLPNCGLTSAATITHAMRGMLAPAAGAAGRISVHAFGFGRDHNADLLASISAAASGCYYFIETAESIPGAFADALGGLLSVVAQNATLTLAAPAGGACEIAAVHTGFDVRAMPDGSHVINVRDLYAEERKDAVVEFAVAPSAEGHAGDALVAARAELKYTDVRAGEVVTRDAELLLRRSPPPVPAAAGDERVALHRTRLATATRMREAIALADSGRHADARKLLADEMLTVTALVDTIPEESGDAAQTARRAVLRGIRADLRRCEGRVGSEVQYDGGGRHLATTTMGRHFTQRNHGAGYTLSIAATSSEPRRSGNGSSDKAAMTLPPTVPLATAPPPPPRPASPRGGGTCFAGLLAGVRRILCQRRRRKRGLPPRDDSSPPETSVANKDTAAEDADAVAAGDQYATTTQSLMVQHARLTVLSATMRSTPEAGASGEQDVSSAT